MGNQVLGWVAPRESGATSTVAPDNLNHATINIGGVLTERSNPVRNYGPDQSDTLVIPINLGGIRGAITARFIDFRSSFHRSIYGD